MKTQGIWCQKTHKNYRGGENNLNISILPKTFFTGVNFSWIVATASSWSCKLSRGAAGFSFSRLADQGLWQSSSLFSKAQLKAAVPVLAGPTLVHLQHLYHPVTGILARTKIKTILERRFGKWQCYKALLVVLCKRKFNEKSSTMLQPDAVLGEQHKGW